MSTATYPVSLMARAKVLREKGHSYREVAEMLGVSYSTVYRWLNQSYADRNRHQAREAKRRRTGTCVLCGGQTRYGGKPGKAPVSRVCGRCNSNILAPATSRARRGTGPRGRAVLAYLSEERHMMEVCRHFGLTKGWASGLLHRFMAYGLIERPRRGVYVAAAPSPTEEMEPSALS